MSDPHEAVSRRSIGARRNPATEAAVLDAAAEILAAGGPKAMTMDAVAKRARAGKATLYRWWPSRGVLLVAVYERLKGRRIQQGYSHADTGSLEGDLTRFFAHVFHAWSDGTGQIFAAIIAEAQTEPDVAEALARYREERIAALVPVIARAARRGELAPRAEPEAIATTVVAVLWYHLLTGQTGRPPAEIARSLAPAWLRG